MSNPFEIKLDSARCPNSVRMSPFYEGTLDKILVTEGEIYSRTQKLAQEIVDFYQERPFICLVVLKGAMTFFNLLKNCMTQVYEQRNIKNMIMDEYIRIKSYVNTESTGKVTIETSTIDLEKLKDKEILIIEDIQDSGHSLDTLIKFLDQYKPKAIENCVLLKIPEHVKYDTYIRFIAFLGPPVYYVGFGLDYNEYFRDCSHIGILSDAAKDRFKQ